MQEEPDKISRQVVPRWRQLHRTRSEELRGTGKIDEQWQRQLRANRKTEVVRAASEWQVNPSLANASEFVAVALMTEHEQRALGAARQILASNSTATDATKLVAKRLVSGPEYAGLEPPPASNSEQDRRKTINAEVARHKSQLVLYPRNALLYVDVARLYSSIGQDIQANNAMERAIKLAPDSRFVLRSAARLFVHDADVDRARDLLRRSRATEHDPWLLSAELALSSLAGRTSRLIPKARSILTSISFAPVQVSELAAALGTIELVNGSLKRAKKLIRQSLIDPTENSIAQARWIAQQLGTDFNERYLMMRNTYEARAEYGHFRGVDAREIVQHCRRWWEDEPFSSRPAILGSYTATARLFDYKLALEFANAGLDAIPNSIVLRNNKIVALAKLGLMREARQELDRIRDRGPDFDPVRRATEGLIYFREGNLEAGRRCYKEAIQRALETGNTSVVIRARAHLLEEECLAGNIETTGEAIAKLRYDFHSTENASLIAFWDELEKHLHINAQNVVAPNWNSKKQD